jgi:hypothetical protein
MAPDLTPTSRGAGEGSGQLEISTAGVMVITEVAVEVRIGVETTLLFSLSKATCCHVSDVRSKMIIRMR